MQLKQKFTIEQQINHMKNQNIKFDLFDEIETTNFLTYSNYYFKVKSFAKNYKKNNGQYEKLDFEYLRKFSILDTNFRELVLELSLLCEHLVKVAICRSCSQNIDDDGYKIVKDFFNQYGFPSSIKRYDEEKYSIYSKTLLDKYRNDMPVWVLMEILDFGELILFYEFYKENHNIDKISNFNLYAIKSLRNVAAHNSCILHTLTIQPANIKISTSLKQLLHRYGLLSRRETEIRIPIIHDFLCLILVFTAICPNTKIKSMLTKKIIGYFKKCERHPEYFDCEHLILKRYLFIKKATYKILRNK